MCGLGTNEFGVFIMTPKYMPDTDSREFLNAVSTGKNKGEFASVLIGSWQHSPSWKHGGTSPGSLVGQREALVSSWPWLSLTLCMFDPCPLTVDSFLVLYASQNF